MELKRDEIIKALECCLLSNEHQEEDCEHCTFNECPTTICQNLLAYHALSLIKSQEQMIIDLEKRLRYLLQSKTISEYDEVDIHTKEYVKDIHSLDANIEHLNEHNKELTEENERLRGRHQWDWTKFYCNGRKGVCDIGNWINGSCEGCWYYDGKGGHYLYESTRERKERNV